MFKIKKGDTVQVVAGRDKGKRGKVLQTFPTEAKVRVEGIFVQKKHIKPGASRKVPNGGIVDRPGKISVSNVMFYSEKLGRPVRVGFKVLEDGKKVRVARGPKGQETALD